MNMNKTTHVSRREFIAASMAGAMGATMPATAVTAASNAGAASVPRGKIGKVEISRLILGTNIITAHMHPRDLLYLKDLSSHYNTDEKILETFAISEANGVDAFMTHHEPRVIKLLKQHRDKNRGKLKWFVAPEPKVKEPAEFMNVVQELVDGGAAGIYVHGAAVDPLVAKGKVKTVSEFVDIIKATGLPAGIACHNLDSLKACQTAGLGCDFYLKTFHHWKYPSAPRPDELGADTDYFKVFRCQEKPHGFWCLNPEETAAYMRTIKQPWVAYKVMAAGVIPPRDAFRYAFANGADFILAGMFDFQVAEDAQITADVLKALQKRARPWCG